MSLFILRKKKPETEYDTHTLNNLMRKYQVNTCNHHLNEETEFYQTPVMSLCVSCAIHTPLHLPRSSYYPYHHRSHFLALLYNSVPQWRILHCRVFSLAHFKNQLSFKSLLIYRFLFHSFLFLSMYLLNNKGHLISRDGQPEFDCVQMMQFNAFPYPLCILQMNS